MSSLGLQYIGSFQKQAGFAGARFAPEGTLEEVWTRVAQMGSSEFVRLAFHPNIVGGNDWDAIVQYAVVRVRQAVEFREAARQSTLLTSPLALYYSFLNLKRAFLALRSEKIPSPGHGLRFNLAADLLNSSASPVKQGTFADYLSIMQIGSQISAHILLSESLSRIIEIGYDYAYHVGRESFVVPITVNARMNVVVLLIFPESLTDFRSNWQQEFPSLASCCTLESQGNVVRVNGDIPSKSYQEISDFCHAKFETDLIFRDAAIWYLVRQVNPSLVLPRAAYYFLAVFVLGSIVRYQPELMLEVTNPDSQLGWLLQRVVKAAERYYPQLMLNWLYQRELYF